MSERTSAMTRRALEQRALQGERYDTLAAMRNPNFVPFAEGRVVGWIPNLDGCHIWTGAVVRGMPVVREGNATVSVARALWQRAGRAFAPGNVLRRTCNTSKCVNINHYVEAGRYERLDDIARRIYAGPTTPSVTAQSPADVTLADQFDLLMADYILGKPLSDAALARWALVHRREIAAHLNMEVTQ